MAEPATTFVLIPALIMGGIIGLVELVFVHADERGMGWFVHGLHALPVTMLFVFVSMNVGWALNFLHIGIAENIWVDLGVRFVIALIAMLKIAGAAAIAGRVGEKIIHTLIIGVLVFAAPYVWMLIGPIMPFS
ncbi:hypothetical protein JW930_07445 [Candidatus Woesearchaeota archaeon]|nr:hypothetical protein [Candidatus Woesearchaeota archaeon]